MTEAEERLWTALRGRRLGSWKFKRQLPMGSFRPDFVCAQAKLIVEIDGSQHVEQENRDQVRTEFLEREGYRVLRVWNHDVMARMDSVLDAVFAALGPHPARAARELSLSPKGEGN